MLHSADSGEVGDACTSDSSTAQLTSKYLINYALSQSVHHSFIASLKLEHVVDCLLMIYIPRANTRCYWCL